MSTDTDPGAADDPEGATVLPVDVQLRLAEYLNESATYLDMDLSVSDPRLSMGEAEVHFVERVGYRQGVARSFSY